MSYH
jgi:hypothetical protein